MYFGIVTFAFGIAGAVKANGQYVPGFPILFFWCITFIYVSWILTGLVLIFLAASFLWGVVLKQQQQQPRAVEEGNKQPEQIENKGLGLKRSLWIAAEVWAFIACILCVAAFAFSFEKIITTNNNKETATKMMNETKTQW